ncbi:dehydrogenase [Lithospermum erythrorhizon]|uniref:Dehydrogenase n=1 Tax=Lithospermum erythrorhizon TaxID=34254 RepID=A0AAV3QMR0_LITER
MEGDRSGRDERRGKEALERLKVDINASKCVMFHQLDVADPASIATLVDFIKNKFGRLRYFGNILSYVKNAGLSGVKIDDPLLHQELLEAEVRHILFDEEMPEEIQQQALANVMETQELAEQCIQINYYGTKRMVESFIQLLQLSDAPRIVNVSAGMGKLKLQNNEWAKNVLSNTESLTEEKVDNVINEFLEHLKKGPIQRKLWPFPFSAYKVSKASMNAYTRIISKKYPEMRINCVHPGYVQTDITLGTGPLTTKEGAKSVVKLAILPNEGPSGLFFSREEVTSF